MNEISGSIAAKDVRDIPSRQRRGHRSEKLTLPELVSIATKKRVLTGYGSDAADEDPLMKVQVSGGGIS